MSWILPHRLDQVVSEGQHAHPARTHVSTYVRVVLGRVSVSIERFWRGWQAAQAAGAATAAQL